MRDLRRLALGLVVAAPFLLGAAAGGAEDGEVAFTFGDSDVIESSGLAVVDSLVSTTNDSGDSGRVFTVDPDSGRTVGVTSWSGEPVDVEALAPAGPGRVWVGDIGDNGAVRDSVEVLRVPVGPGDRVLEGGAAPEAYELVYPDGAHDAEALLAHPLTGRLFVVTKGVFAATVYAAPMRLRPDRPNRLRPVAQAPGLVTDATFLPGGGAVVMRTYTSAFVVSFPTWDPVTSWQLPNQDQGEGVAVNGADLLLSTEGVQSKVLRVPLPDEARAADLLGSPVWTILSLLPWS
ncbi:MAG: hypothetical protein LH477_04290 [Nocardioides sp.]|nr:hypothetical protein [Nocardioides sp.]